MGRECTGTDVPQLGSKQLDAECGVQLVDPMMTQRSARGRTVWTVIIAATGVLQVLGQVQLLTGFPFFAENDRGDRLIFDFGFWILAIVLACVPLVFWKKMKRIWRQIAALAGLSLMVAAYLGPVLAVGITMEHAGATLPWLVLPAFAMALLGAVGLAVSAIWSGILLAMRQRTL